jgi:hypothetical protein
MATTPILPRAGALNDANLRRLTSELRADPVRAAEAAALVERDLRGFVRRSFKLDAIQSAHLDKLLADDSAKMLGAAYALLLRHGGTIQLELPPQQVQTVRSFTVEAGVTIDRDDHGRVTGVNVHVKVHKKG